jgi:hypothetical protein
MVEFTLLSFGMCAALHHPGLGLVQQFDDFIGIGQVKSEGKQCEMFFFGRTKCRRWSASKMATPSGPLTTASPSMVNVRALSFAAAPAIAG